MLSAPHQVRQVQPTLVQARPTMAPAQPAAWRPEVVERRPPPGRDHPAAVQRHERPQRSRSGPPRSPSRSIAVTSKVGRPRRRACASAWPRRSRRSLAPAFADARPSRTSIATAIRSGPCGDDAGESGSGGRPFQHTAPPRGDRARDRLGRPQPAGDLDRARPRPPQRSPDWELPGSPPALRRGRRHEATRAGARRTSARPRRVLAVGGLLREVALPEPNDATAAQVDRGEDSKAGIGPPMTIVLTRYYANIRTRCGREPRHEEDGPRR